MDAIIQAVDVLPDYFEKFCSVLNIMSCYDSVKESLHGNVLHCLQK